MIVPSFSATYLTELRTWPGTLSFQTVSVGMQDVFPVANLSFRQDTDCAAIAKSWPFILVKVVPLVGNDQRRGLITTIKTHHRTNLRHLAPKLHRKYHSVTVSQALSELLATVVARLA